CEAGKRDRNLCPQGPQTTTATNFSSWYNFAEGLNKPYVLYLSLEPNDGVLTFQSNFFFPLDAAGFGDSAGANDGKSHNFNFTTEVHTEFRYQGGEKFTFTGD